MVLYGVDRIEEYISVFSGKRLGLITSVSGVNQALRSSVEVLQERFGLTALFAPEHGVRGDRAAGETVETYTDPQTGVMVYSLYRKDSKRLEAHMLEAVDAVVYDIQDVGTRFYTYISTLLYALEDCARAHKELIVLDRPNPLGDETEGGLLEEGYKSFVGCHSLCIRYGLSVGELAGMLNDACSIGCFLTVIPCQGWKHRQHFPATGNLWMMPSPGIPRYETALLYPGTCLIEGTNLSEGRGTSCPFELIGAPFVQAHALADAINTASLPGVIATPAYFTPSASKHAGTACDGIQLHITNAQAFRPVRTGIELLDALRRLYPNHFHFLPPPVGGKRPFISLLSGCGVFENPEWDKNALLDRFALEARQFTQYKQAYHLYE